MEQQNHELIDGAFYVEQTRWKTWRSYKEDGTLLLLSLRKEQCISATRFYLKGCQEGWENNETKSYDGVVGGKL